MTGANDNSNLGDRVIPYQAAVNVANDVAQANWSQKQWVWIPDKTHVYVAASVKETRGDKYLVALDSGEEREVIIEDTEKCNPPKFDKVEDMADLTYLNEPSVVHNLKLRYYSNMIYTYSGLFLVAVNPYRNLPIYSEKQISGYKSKRRNEAPPHIFAIADTAYQDMIANRENQSVLITGESGAGKTENTKKVIQYLAAIATDRTHGQGQHSLEAKILQANPLLESFGNAQTVRNNNSSRFGKFIRIEFNGAGFIAGANIEKYLLEKSRVTHQTSKERNFHIFYQLLAGADEELKGKLILDGKVGDYQYTKMSNKTIPDVDDGADFRALLDSMRIMDFQEQEIFDILRMIAAVLHLGNVRPQAGRDDQAQLNDTAAAERACHLLGIPVSAFVKALLRPQMKAGRETVIQQRSCEQVVYSIEALARATYERLFSWLIERINEALNRPSPKNKFIGVLDIAGFEIFQVNSFEQLLINYTNEKLQQFFNHHMFVLEQEEYRQENIEWRFIDFGLDLQPTIDLIEKNKPIGVLSCLDEECVFPQATDRSFTEKLNSIWKGKSAKYETPRLPGQSFILQHYAAKVEYSTSGWLDKNKDPLNENITDLLAASTEPFVASLFADYASDVEDVSLLKRPSIVKKGAFRTVAQRHKEQLSTLMARLHETQPHFVRCILPNEDKRPGRLDLELVLDQLRCNGVLEGIRICRAGFPNRLPFADFRARYEVLCPKAVPSGFIDGRHAAEKMLDVLMLSKNQYRIGTSKVFFRAGVLAELEERRDHQLSTIFTRVQAIWRGYIARKRYTRKVAQLRAIRVIQKNARVYVQLREWLWWRLYAKVKPLLSVTRVDNELQKREEEILYLMDSSRRLEDELKKMQQMRNALESDKRHLEEAISAERNAATDQAEILRRTQERVVELDRLVMEMSGELQGKISLADDLVAQCTAIEADRSALVDRVAELEGNLDRMEKDRQAKEQELRRLESELAEASTRIDKLDGERKAFEEQVTTMQADFAAALGRESELTRQKAKIAAQLAESEEKLSKEIAQREAAEMRRVDLDASLRDSREALEESQRTVDKLNDAISRKEAEIGALLEKLATETTERDAADKNRRELSVKLSALEAELENEQCEREKLSSSKKRMEAELDHLHAMMLEKGDSVNRQSELRQLREQELADAKLQLQTLQSEAEESRRNFASQTQALKIQLDQANLDNTKLLDSKTVLEAKLSLLAQEMEVTVEDSERHARSARQLAADLQNARTRLDELQAKLIEAASAKAAHESVIVTLTTKLEDLERLNVQLERETTSLTSSVAHFREENEDLNTRVIALEESKKKLQANLSDLQSRFDDEEAAKTDLQRQLTTQSNHLESLKQRHLDEVQAKSTEMEELRRKLESELENLKLQIASATVATASLEKAKARLTAEVEDVRHENERLQSSAKQAERNAKGLEQQLQQSIAGADAERRQRELAESEARKLQSTIDGVRLELEARNQAFLGLQRQKNELETELRALIDEIGEGGKNVHELEKNLRRATARADELSLQLEDEQNAKVKLLDAKAELESALAELRRKAEADLMAKESQMEETRKILLREINEQGEQLDVLNEANAELAKSKRKLQAELDEFLSREDSTAKNRSELEKAKRAAEAALREAQAKLEVEQRSRRDFEDLAKRQEQKANLVQGQVEHLQLQLENSERERRNVQKQVEAMQVELEGNDDNSRASLLLARRVWEKERQELLQRLEASEDEMRALEASRGMASSDVEELKKKIESDYEGRIERLENEKRALLASQRLLQQELEDHVNDGLNFEKQKKLMQSEIEELRHRLETETLAKSEEMAARRKISNELKDAIEKYAAETVRSREYADAAESYRIRANELLLQVEQTEVNRMRIEKEVATSRLQIKDLQESIQDVNREKKAAEDRARNLEEQLHEVRELVEERALEAAEAKAAKEKLQSEIRQMHDRLTTESEQRDELVDQMRRKYQKEMQQLNAELETEKSCSLSAREARKQIELEIQNLQAQFDSESRNIGNWRREKERYEQRIDEVSRSLSEALRAQEDAAFQNATTSARIRELQAALDEVEAQKNTLERSKRALEQRVEDFSDQFQEALRTRQALERSLASMETEVTSLRSNLEEQIEVANKATERSHQAQGFNQALQIELDKERESAQELERVKSMLDKQVKELGSRILELEANALSDATRGVARLQAQLEVTQTRLEEELKEKATLAKSVREIERQVRQANQSLAEKEKSEARLKEDIEKLEQKTKKLRQQIEDMEANETTLTMAKRRAEREASEFRDRALRFEKEADRLRTKFELTLTSPVSTLTPSSMKSPASEKSASVSHSIDELTESS